MVASHNDKCKVQIYAYVQQFSITLWWANCSIFSEQSLILLSKHAEHFVINKAVWDKHNVTTCDSCVCYIL